MSKRRTEAATPQKELLAWYRVHGRDLPWRRTRDPYRVLVSEVMLQQTQVDRVLPFYQRFLELFPDEAALATASTEAIHRAWKGLGYPSRVERLRAAVQAVLARGGWPDDEAGLIELPGIGPYTAASVSVFAFGRAVAVVDTNIARIYARRDALPLPLAKDVVWAHAGRELDRDEPIASTNALMDLGATICTARVAHCDRCPWAHRCRARDRADLQHATANPLKVQAVKVRYGMQTIDRRRSRQHIVLALIHHEGKYLAARRRETGDCAGMWELPGGKRESGETDRVALAREVREELGAEVLAARHLLSWTHDAGNSYLTFHLFRVRLFDPDVVQPFAATELRWLEPADFIALDFPKANAPILDRLRRYHRLKA